MSDDTTAPAAEDSTAQAAESPVDATDPAPVADTLDPQGQRLSEEAARWRRQARAEETNRLITEAKLAGLQMREVKRVLRPLMAVPDDFWLATDVTLADLLGDEGEVDEDKVTQAAEAVLVNRPTWRATLKPVGAPSEAVRGDGRYDVGNAEEPTWEALLKGKPAS